MRRPRTIARYLGGSSSAELPKLAIRALPAIMARLKRRTGGHPLPGPFLGQLIRCMVALLEALATHLLRQEDLLGAAQTPSEAPVVKEGSAEGSPEGTVEGSPEGSPEKFAEGSGEGSAEASKEGSAEAVAAGAKTLPEDSSGEEGSGEDSREVAAAAVRTAAELAGELLALPIAEVARASSKLLEEMLCFAEEPPEADSRCVTSTALPASCLCL